MTHRILTILSALCLCALPISAQSDNDNDNSQKDRLNVNGASNGESKGNCPERWTCIVGSACEMIVMVKLSTITSVSKQTYMLEGTQKIKEVTIDTTGNNSIRFYCLSSNRAAQALDTLSNARRVANKHTEGAGSYPSKKYPDATHSHNIEYQVGSPAQLDSIYESVTHAWVKNQAAVLRVKN